MSNTELKVAAIGNSRGVRIPADTLQRYGIGDSVLMEERSDGILLRPNGPMAPKLSWADTAREMAAAAEDWADWDSSIADGLDTIPWSVTRSPRVAEGPSPRYKAPRKRPRKGTRR